MSDKIIDDRLGELADQIDEIDAIIDENDDFDVDSIEDLRITFSEKFQQAVARREEVQNLIDQGASESQISRIYPGYLGSLNAVESRLQDLQQALAFLQLHQAQWNTHHETLEFTSEVCNELINRCDFSVDFLPVIWDGYATMPIDPDSLYAIYVPRGRTDIRGGPLLGHEIGHVVYDNIPSKLDSREEFADALSAHCEEFQPRKQDLVERVWRDWFVELLCDGCGLITFGPAYVVRMNQRLRKSHPYQLPTRNNIQTHPPAALRWDFVTGLAEARFPSEIYEAIEPTIEEYNTYLKYSGSKSRKYHEWVDQTLLDHIVSVIDDMIESDLPSLTTELLDDISPKSVPARERRLMINKELIEV